MSMKNSEKWTALFVGSVLALAVVLVAARAVELLDKVERQHPDWGIVEWGLSGVWLASVFVVMQLVARACEKKKWSKEPIREGTAAAAMYVFLCAVFYIIVSGQ